MRYIQRSVDGFPIEELCPVLCCMILVDPAIVSDRAAFMRLRNAIEHFRDRIQQDKDALAVVKVACAYADGFETERPRFAAPVDFKYGIPTDSRVASVDLTACIDLFEQTALNELERYRQLDRVLMQPKLAVVTLGAEIDIEQPKLSERFWLSGSTAGSKQPLSLYSFFDRFASNVLLSVGTVM